MSFKWTKICLSHMFQSIQKKWYITSTSKSSPWYKWNATFWMRLLPKEIPNENKTKWAFTNTHRRKTIQMWSMWLCCNTSWKLKDSSIQYDHIFQIYRNLPGLSLGWFLIFEPFVIFISIWTISYSQDHLELKLRKHIKNIHANKKTPSETVKTVKRDSNNDENEMIIDTGQGFTDPFAIGPWI